MEILVEIMKLERLEILVTLLDAYPEAMSRAAASQNALPTASVRTSTEWYGPVPGDPNASRGPFSRDTPLHLSY
jgi:hypothetical protein